MSENARSLNSLNSEFVAELLQAPTLDAQNKILLNSGLPLQESVQFLLERATEAMGSDLERASALTTLCASASEEEGWLNLAAQANYLQAQIYAIRAEFELALTQIETARQQYSAAGNIEAALRINLGWVSVMHELGRSKEALANGVPLLQRIDAQFGEHSLMAARMRNNLGICCEQLGQFDDAMQYWIAAENTFRTNQAEEEACNIQNNRGLVYLKLGQAQNALDAFEGAAKLFAANDLVFNLVKARINMSQAYFMLSDPGRGLVCLEEARTLIEPLGTSADNLVLLLDTADAYQTLNLQNEAAQLYQQVVPEMQNAGMADEQLRALLGMSSALLAQNQSQEALTLLNKLNDIAPAAQPTPMRCRLMLNRALALSQMGNHTEASEQAMAALAEATTQGWQRQQAEAHLLVAQLLSTSPIQINEHLEHAYRIAQQAGWHSLSTHVQQRLGRVYLHDGRTTDAESALLGAIADIEQARTTLVEDHFRIAFLRDKADAYDDLVKLHLQRNRASGNAMQQQAELRAAFAFAERAKSRALLDMMNDAQWRDAHHSARVTFNLDEVQSHLSTGTTLLYYYICGDDISAFVISKNRHEIDCVQSLARLSTITPLLDALATQWERFSAGDSFATRHASQLEASTQRILFGLYEALIAPVQSAIHAHSTDVFAASKNIPLVIVAHGALHHVPFHALHDGSDYLIERYEISYAPSATIFSLSQKRQALGLGKALVVGVDDDSIPMARVEAEQIANQLSQPQLNILPNVVLRVGTEATVQHVQADVTGCDIVHLACHGLFRHDNPLFSSLQLQDGKLTAAGAMQLKLNGALVTLGACESGRTEIIAGDEMLGLPRAFLGAGASSVLVSLWLVHDKTSAEFMRGWYEQILLGTPRAQALRMVQKEIKKRQPHPYYWAPFFLIGQR